MEHFNFDLDELTYPLPRKRTSTSLGTLLKYVEMKHTEFVTMHGFADPSLILTAVQVRHPGRWQPNPKLFLSQNETKFSGDDSLYTSHVNQGSSGVLGCFGIYL